MSRAARRRAEPGWVRSLLTAPRPVKAYGMGNVRHTVAYHRDLWSYFADVSRRAPSPRAVMLVGQNFLDREFLEFDGPKVFATWEAPRHMTRGTVEILESGRVDDYHYSYADPDPAERMYYPSLLVDRLAVAAGLEGRIGERRPLGVCMVNRYVDPEPGTLYRRRIAVADAFGERIDLYGRPSWDSGAAWDHPRYLGPADDKIATLRGYTFNVCFENVDWEGYVTEKLVDAVVGGCVPLYLGGGGLAGDAVPADCWIDCGGLSPEEIVEIVTSMPHDEVVEMRRRGVEFLRSEAADRLTPRHYRRGVIRRLARQSGEADLAAI